MIELGTVSRVGRNKENLVVSQHQRTSFLIKKLIFLEIIFLMGNFKYCFPNNMNKMTNLKVSSISLWAKSLGTHSIVQCSGCRKETLFSNVILLSLNFLSISKLFPCPLHQIFHWYMRKVAEQLHSVENCMKWKPKRTMTANCQNVTSYINIRHIFDKNICQH